MHGKKILLSVQMAAGRSRLSGAALPRLLLAGEGTGCRDPSTAGAPGAPAPRVLALGNEEAPARIPHPGPCWLWGTLLWAELLKPGFAHGQVGLLAGGSTGWCHWDGIDGASVETRSAKRHLQSLKHRGKGRMRCLQVL